MNNGRSTTRLTIPGLLAEHPVVLLSATGMSPEALFLDLAMFLAASPATRDMRTSRLSEDLDPSPSILVSHVAYGAVYALALCREEPGLRVTLLTASSEITIGAYMNSCHLVLDEPLAEFNRATNKDVKLILVPEDPCPESKGRA